MTIQCRQHGLGDTLRILQHIIVPEAQDGIALGVEVSGAFLVSRGIEMAAAIEFDNERRLPAGKIGEIGTYWQLANKLVAFDLPVPQHIPEPVFRLGFPAP